MRQLLLIGLLSLSLIGITGCKTIENKKQANITFNMQALGEEGLILLIRDKKGTLEFHQYKGNTEIKQGPSTTINRHTAVKDNAAIRPTLPEWFVQLPEDGEYQLLEILENGQLIINTVINPCQDIMDGCASPFDPDSSLTRRFDPTDAGTIAHGEGLKCPCKCCGQVLCTCKCEGVCKKPLNSVNINR